MNEGEPNGIKVRIELGRGHLSSEDVSQLDVGSVIELDSLADAPLDVYASGGLLARGDAVIADGKLGVRVNEIVGKENV